MNLKELFAQNPSSLNEAQKEAFVTLLNEFQDIFSKNVVTGNCELVEHEIKLKDCRSIKQALRRIPIHMQDEIAKVIEEMRQAEVIEESKSPWMSLGGGLLMDVY
ncbi:hypothetical protein P5V15_001458 [Pogonomyrmex californicus]